jgi:glucose-1-phosphate thymidylyltransferase
VKAYVLAAGYATRMYPLTRDVPKALLEVGGRPILSHVMERLRELEALTHVVLVTNDRFYEQFRAWADAQEPWVDITVLNDGTRTDEDRLGALGDLKLAIDRVPLGDGHAVVLASDHLFDIDLEAVYRDFLARGRTTLLVRRAEPPAGPSPYNEVTLDDDGRVVRMREKPSDPQADLSAIALYFMTADDLALLPDYLETGNHDAPGYFLSWLAARVPCYATPLRTRWFDIGSLEGLEEARARFERGDPYG